MTEPDNIKFDDTSGIVDILEADFGLDRISWMDLNLNRSGTKLVKAAMTQKGVDHPHVGFRWNDGDGSTTRWYPQFWKTLVSYGTPR